VIAEHVSFKAAAQEGRLARLDAGAGNAKILSYATTRPATGADPGGPLICSHTLDNPAGTINYTTGALTLNQDADGLVLVTGVVQWCRVVNGADEFCFDMDAGEAGSGAEAIFVDTQVYAGGGLRLVACVLG